MCRFCRQSGIAALGVGLSAVVGTAFGPVEAQNPRPAAKKTELKPALRRLIGELGSTSRRVRVRAERELLKLGPELLPHLPPPELLPNVTVREAVFRVRVRLEHIAAKRSVQPSRVTLSGTYPLSRILVELTKQTRNAVDGSALPGDLRDKPVAVNHRNATFWAVLGDLSRRARIVFSANRDGNGLVAHKRAGTIPTIAVDAGSAFRLAVTSLQWKPLAGDPKHRLLRVRWELTAEPRLRPLFLKYSGMSLSAVTNRGKRLPPFDADAKLELPVASGSSPLKLRSDFVVGQSETVGQIAFRGKLNLLTAAGQLPVTFRNLMRAKDVAKRRGGVTVTVRSVKRRAAKVKPGEKPRDRVSVRVSVSYDSGGPAFESHRTWIFHNRVFLQLADGKRIRPQPGFTTLLQRDGAVGLVYDFEVPSGAAAKSQFVYVAPTLLIDVPVELKFDRVPIPPPPARTTR